MHWGWLIGSGTRWSHAQCCVFDFFFEQWVYEIWDSDFVGVVAQVGSVFKTMSQLGLPGPEPVPQSVEIVVWVALLHDAAALPLCFTLTGGAIFVSSVYFCVSLLAIWSGHCHLECARVRVSMYICISMHIYECVWVSGDQRSVLCPSYFLIRRRYVRVCMTGAYVYAAHLFISLRVPHSPPLLIGLWNTMKE